MLNFTLDCKTKTKQKQKTSQGIVNHTFHIGIGTNLSAIHGLPTAINLASNLAIKQIATDAQILAYLEPLPTTLSQTAAFGQIEGLIQALCMAVFIFFLHFFTIFCILDVLLRL